MPRRLPGRRLWIALAMVVGLAALVSATAYRWVLRAELPPYFATDEEHFLFGSIGTEAEGVPYWIWLVLPRLFPEHLPGPGGYAALGLLARDGQELPIGLSRVTVGVPRVGINCALCHTGSLRARPEAPPTIYPGAPAHQAGWQQYRRFLVACASDPRFTADTLLGEIARNVRLSAIERLVYRYLIIPSTRRALLRLGQADAWTHDRPDWGRGRTDAVNHVKFSLLEQPADTTEGTSDTMPVWNLARHAGFAYQWDGLNTDLTETVLSSALQSGTPAGWLDRDFARWGEAVAERQSSLARVQRTAVALSSG
jgi:hypothetical protein